MKHTEPCSHARAPAALPEHPIETLTAEHRVILSVLDAVEAECRRLEARQPLRQDFWAAACDFLAQFADRCHHEKEEQLLFPALCGHGMDSRMGPIAVMKHEHVEGRALRERLLEATRRGDARDVTAAAQALAVLLREHIAKEDTVLFQIARHLLHEDDVQRLNRAFAAVEHGVGEGTHCRYVALAERLKSW
jgi:hemerythrin-like domain-containing protein